MRPLEPAVVITHYTPQVIECCARLPLLTLIEPCFALHTKASPRWADRVLQEGTPSPRQIPRRTTCLPPSTNQACVPLSTKVACVSVPFHLSVYILGTRPRLRAPRLLRPSWSPRIALAEACEGGVALGVVGVQSTDTEQLVYC